MPTDILSLTFGAELEVYLPEGQTMQTAARAVSQRIGQPVNVEGYNHNTRPSWKVVTDGSLGDYGRGAEFVSPVLTGQAGLDQLAAVCEALTDFGCIVNKRCGLHIHVGARAMNIDGLKRLARMYQAYEQVIDGMMPESRRASNNGYCRSLANLTTEQINGARDAYALGNLCGGGDRYGKINFHSMQRHGTVEFRQHSGTCDARKAVNWAKLCLRMVAAAMDNVSLFGRTAAPVAVAQMNTARRGTKAWQVGEMLLRPEGVTGQEVMAALNWPSVSIPQQAKACGLTVTSQRTGRIVRWFANRAEAQAPATIDRTITGFCTVIGATEEERAYIARRTQNLSGPVAWAA